MTDDTATLKEAALTLFAHRTMSNEDMVSNPRASKLAFVRFYDANGDYIQLRVMRNYHNPSTLIFDDTGGGEADPVYTTVTQYYADLDLHTFVPRFNMMFDVSAGTFAYATTPFSVTDYELLNENEDVVAEAADTTTGFTITKGTRYLFHFTLRFFNDMVEQSPGEGTRCIVTTDGLKVIERRMVHTNSPQDLGRPPLYLGVGGTGAYYIANASDGRWTYDASASSYVAISSGNIFPTSAVADDAFVFCREGTTPDSIEGLQFTLSANGTRASGSSLQWQYWPIGGGDWSNLHSVVDDTEMLSDDGTVRWNMPTDIDPAAELKSGTVGYYYRCKLVGGGWTDIPQVAAATSIKPLVVRTVQSENDLQLPFNRRIADTVGVPYVGSAAKGSAEFGTSALVTQTREDDGTLLSESYEPVREIATFTDAGVTVDETVALGSYTGTVSSGIISIPNTNPRPIRLYSAVNATGTQYDVADRLVTYTVSGSDWATKVPLPNGTFTIEYLGTRITPSDATVQNIISISSTVQELAGPKEVWLNMSEMNPADSNSGAATALTPLMIQSRGIPVRGAPGDSMSPNLLGADGSGAIINSGDFGAGRFLGMRIPRKKGDKQHYMNPRYSLGMVDALKGNLIATISVGYPMVMCVFDMSDHLKNVNPTLVVSASRKTFKDDAVFYNILMWGEGDLASEKAYERQTGWKLVTSSDTVKGDAGVPANVTVKLDLRFAEDGNGSYTSPFIDENGKLYVLIVVGDKQFTDGKYEFKSNIKLLSWNIFHIADATEKAAKKKAKQAVGDLAVSYIGMAYSSSPEGKSGSFNFRRGIDWLYYPGQIYATWRVDATKGDDMDSYAVQTGDGASYSPLLPSCNLNQSEEYYRFGTLPGSEVNVTLYTRYRPVGTGGVYVSVMGDETRIDNLNGCITVNSVGWDGDALWNSTDPSFSDDHGDSSGGDGAGMINLTFDIKYWSNTKFRDIYLRYLYYTLPEIKVSYLTPKGIMFSRAECTQLSHNPEIQPAYGDSLRPYFEVQFEKKRVA